MNEPKKFKIPRALRLKALGYQFMPLICLALLIVTCWEFNIRVDAMSAPLSMFFDMAEGEGIPITRALQYFEWNMLEPLVYLICCMITGLLSLLSCRRPLGAILMTPLCTAMSLYSLMRANDSTSATWHFLPCVLLIAMTVFSVLNLSTYRIRQHNLIRNLRKAGEENALVPLGEALPGEDKAPLHQSLPHQEESICQTLSREEELEYVCRGNSLKEAHSKEAPLKAARPVRRSVPHEETAPLRREPLFEEDEPIRHTAHRFNRKKEHDVPDAPRLTDAPRLRHLASPRPMDAQSDSSPSLSDHQSA